MSEELTEAQAKTKQQADEHRSKILDAAAGQGGGTQSYYEKDTTSQWADADAMVMAIKESDIEKVKAILDAGVDPSTRNIVRRHSTRHIT